MTLRIHNTLTRTKEVFTPIDPKNVRVYVCGPTVYDYAHIGNARPAIVFDVLFRLLRHLYGESNVTYVRNITDVDDKINARALRDYPGMELNSAIRAVTEKTYDQYQKDVSALGCLPPTFQPRATEHIQGMVDMIRTLINRGHAYEAGGEVLFDVMAMKDYGALSGRKQDELKAGARVAVDAHKKNASDFVLWKQSAADEPGWDSPWGRGRPGWHIECSVMSKAHLGEVFDIHGGGLDLIFPHHENEIAQSRCANGTHGTDVMANYWMHNGFLQVEGQKMSKSLGNFITIADLLETEKFGGRKWLGSTLKWAMLKTSYREPIDWTVTSLLEANDKLDDLARVLGEQVRPSSPTQDFLNALSDDVNMSEAKIELERLANFIRNSQNPVVDILDAQSSLLACFNLIGIDIKSHFPKGIGGGLSAEKRLHIVNLISFRLQARKAKDWAESDRIRDELDAMGVSIKDNKDGTTTWEVKR